MQNRFAAKDFFYIVIGLVACFLLFFNMLKTDREVETLKQVEDALKSQETMLGRLEASISNLSGGMQIDPEVLERIAAGQGGGSRGGSASGDNRESADEDVQANIASPPSYTPGADIRFSGQTKSVNRIGLPQEWQTAPDRLLPEDFAPGDTLILSWGTEPQTLTPIVATDSYARQIHWETHEYLVNMDLDAPFELVPGLARSWKVSDDGMELTFRLFPEATWSDGRPVTADDVIFSWDLVFNPRIDAPHLRGYVEPNVESYEKVDQHTVRFHMKQPYFDAVSICGNLIHIIPKHIYGDYDEETFNRGISDLVVGSGPWVLEGWDRNRQIVLRRNENYWGPKPPLERIIIRLITNDLANLQEFWAGNVDAMIPTAEQWSKNINSQRLSERGRGVMFYSPRGGYSYIGYNLRRSHFRDKRTRQALTMLIDRQAMIDTLLDGQGMLISGPFFYAADQYNKDIDPLPYDPERAKALLAEVGWEMRDGILHKDLSGDGELEPFEITFLMSSGPALTQQIQIFVQQAFEQAGIRVRLDQLEWSVFLERVHERQFDMVCMAWTGSPEGDPYQIWHSSQQADRGSNHVGFNNAEADQLMEEGRREMDRAKRMEIWHEFHRIIHEEQPYTFLWGRPSRAFIDHRFNNVVEHDYRLYYGEWYVPAEVQLR